jgi:hypothetical protein
MRELLRADAMVVLTAGTKGVQMVERKDLPMVGTKECRMAA